MIQTLQEISDGSHDRNLADNPDLHCEWAAEILIVIETLENAGR